MTAYARLGGKDERACPVHYSWEEYISIVELLSDRGGHLPDDFSMT